MTFYEIKRVDLSIETHVCLNGRGNFDEKTILQTNCLCRRNQYASRVVQLTDRIKSRLQMRPSHFPARLKPLKPSSPEPHTCPHTLAYREESQLVERFRRLTAEQKADVGIILGNQGELLGNGGVEATVNLINLKPMTLTAIKADFDRLDRGGLCATAPKTLTDAR
jgi:hypothetical protein